MSGATRAFKIFSVSSFELAWTSSERFLRIGIESLDESPSSTAVERLCEGCRPNILRNAFVAMET
jgi:hypothetical protein